MSSGSAFEAWLYFDEAAVSCALLAFATKSQTNLWSEPLFVACPKDSGRQRQIKGMR